MFLQFSLRFIFKIFLKRFERQLNMPRQRSVDESGEKILKTFFHIRNDSKQQQQFLYQGECEGCLSCLDCLTIVDWPAPNEQK